MRSKEGQGHRLRAGVALAALLLVCACTTMPSERAEAPPLPSAWADAPVGADAPISDWWRRFEDPVLDQLVAEALTSGPSVQIAALRVREARAASRTVIAQYLPELTASASGNYRQALEGGSLEGGANELMSGSYGPQVSWEIPLYARIDSARAGSRANTASAIADARGAQVTLAADVAQAYVDLRAAQNSRAALVELIAAADELAGILATGVQAGFTSEADAADARRLAESTRARLPGSVIEQRRAENVLATLRGFAPGTEPEEMRAALAAAGETPSLELAAAPATPADLLRLRPDVARAEAQTLVAAADLGNARADLLPRLNLTGAITVTDNLVGQALAGDTTLLTATPLISLPLFDWGSRWAQVRVRDARFEQSLIQYRQTVTQAVAEASNALVSLDQGAKRLASARGAEDAAAVTARGSRAAYGAGIQSLSDRLRAEQQLIDARLTRISAEAAQASAAISVYRAFGGGPALPEADD